MVNEAPANQAVSVQIIHHVVSPGASAKVLRCPRCRKALATIRALETELHGCGSCGGIWIDNENAKRMLAAPEETFADLARKCYAAAKHPGPRYRRPECAVCGELLDVARTTAASLDVCIAHGTWFDALELAHVIDAARAKRASAAASVGALLASRPKPSS